MILITGATGFLGAELTSQLLQVNERVRCIKRENSSIPKVLIPFQEKIEWVNADILDYSDLDDAFGGVTQVFHCAGVVSFNNKNVKEMMAINVQGTANVVNLCLDYNARLVHVSSVAALGKVKPGQTIKETNFWDGYDKNGQYAISKYCGEMEVWRGINEGLSAAIVNPSVIIGENVGNKGSGQIFNFVKSGLKFYTTGVTGFVDVKDVAKSMIRLMDSDITEERFILNSENYSYKQLFQEISVAYNMPVPQIKVNKWVLTLAVRFKSLFNIFTNNVSRLNPELVKTSFNKNLYSNEKAVEKLAITFLPVKESIQQTVNSLKKA